MSYYTLGSEIYSGVSHKKVATADTSATANDIAFAPNAQSQLAAAQDLADKSANAISAWTSANYKSNKERNDTIKKAMDMLFTAQENYRAAVTKEPMK